MTDPIPLPEPSAWQCYWRGDNDSTSWDQWHDASDPMPDEWDGDAPDEVTPHYTADQMRAYAAAARAQALEDARDACERIAEGYRIREGYQWPEMKSDAQTGASDCEDAIRAMKDKTP